MSRTVLQFPSLLVITAGIFWTSLTGAQEEAPILVRAEKVRDAALERSLPLSGRVYSRNDASLSLTLSGELEWVLEPGTRVDADTVVAQLDQNPTLLKKAELEHLAQRERVNGKYLDKELARLKRLEQDNNASERQVDEGKSNRDISELVLRSLQSRIDQVDDELRRSQLLAPFAGVIAERNKRGGEYARPGDVIVRLVDLDNLELRFQMPVVYLERLSEGGEITFTARGSQLTRADSPPVQARVRAIIPAANHNSQTFEVRADIADPSKSQVISGQLVSVSVPIPNTTSTLQIPRDAIVLRSDGSYVYRISTDNTAQQVSVQVGEGSGEWVSVTGALNAGDWVAIRGVERLLDGQRVSIADSAP